IYRSITLRNSIGVLCCKYKWRTIARGLTAHRHSSPKQTNTWKSTFNWTKWAKTSGTGWAWALDSSAILIVRIIIDLGAFYDILKTALKPGYAVTAFCAKPTHGRFLYGEKPRLRRNREILRLGSQRSWLSTRIAA